MKWHICLQPTHRPLHARTGFIGGSGGVNVVVGGKSLGCSTTTRLTLSDADVDMMYYYNILQITNIIILCWLTGIPTIINYERLLKTLNEHFTLEQAYKVSQEMLVDKELEFMAPKLAKYNMELMQMYIKS